MTTRMPPPDEAVRETVRTERSRNVAVQASAGTGKTTLIVDRVVALLGSGDATIDSLAVVTFTRAAAAELRSRIRAKLREEGMEKQLREFSNAWIDTIHGFASRLLRENFSLTGTDPKFLSTSGGFDPMEIQRKWDSWLLSLPGRLTEGQRTTLEQVPSTVIRKLALDMMPLRWLDDIGMLGPSGWSVLHGFAEGNLVDVEQAMGTCSDPTHPKVVAFSEVSKWTRTMLERPRPVDPADLVRLRGLLFRSGGGSKCWTDWKAVKDIFMDARSQLMDVVFPAVLAEPCREGVWELAYGLASKLRAEWDEDRSRLSYDDLLYMAWRSISGSTRLAGILRNRFSHVLIDEFQDTSSDQVDLFNSFLMVGDTLPSGCITVVADDKQSIYGWRSADIETYREFMGTLAGSDAMFSEISTNFRSTSRIVRFVNVFGRELFAGMTEEEAPYGCGYSAIEPRPEAPSGVPVRVLTLPDPPEDFQGNLTGNGYQALCQAEWLAEFITEGLANGGHAGDYALLFRASTHVHHFIEVLEREGIPYFVDATRDYRKRPEMADLRELLRCLLDSDDRQAWIHTLRSMFFGLDDRTITGALDVGTTGYRSETPTCPPGAGSAGRTLRAWRESLQRLPLADFLAGLLFTSDLLPAIAASGYQVGRRLGNLQYILETVLSGSTTSVEGLLVLLDEEFAPSTTEETQIPPSDGSAVTLTTIHRAKGLSWKHVVVAAMGGKGASRDCRLLADGHNRIAAFDLGYPVAMPKGDPVRPRTSLWTGIRNREKNRELAESRRMIYVAVTRAEESLTVFRSREKEDSTSPSGLVWNSVEAAMQVDGECCSAGELEPLESSRIAARSTVPPGCDPAGLEPTPMLEVDPRVPNWQPEGAIVGDMVHAVLEKIDFTDPVGWLDASAPSLRRLFRERFAEVRELVENFFSMELPFSLADCTIVGREYPLSELTEEGAQAKYIDLLLDAGDRMIVVDYKTDDLAGRSPEELAEEYRDQQLGYRDDITAIFGKPVLCYLILLRPRLAIPVT